MPKTKEQNMTIRAEKRQLIMDSALHLFAENGFEHTSIGNIATHAGISKGLLYSYFKCKDDLLYQILASGMQTFTDNIHSEMTMEDFITGVEKSFDHIMENRDFFKLYTIISVQPKVAQNLGNLITEYGGLHGHITSLFQKCFGERAAQELMLLSVIMKGYSIISVFGDQQNVVAFDILKKTVVEFVKERYNSNKTI
ncbi:MAG: TetR/AcrR family transcriptional regulator [Bacteroidetes bacterium]|nr:TetR/AcrR family transcriptional regulator [Bacteroidota bacterium]MCL2302989.1 TetR/AcrR family transcriptional regulator [Lentimicrobiaceae bacterium]